MENTPLNYDYELQREKRKSRCKKALKILSPLIAVFIFITLTMCTAAAPRVNHVDAYNGDNRYITFDERCFISAHRAGKTLAPENTLSAFKACLDNGGEYTVDILEFDLHLTKDNQLILLHDDTLNRTSNADEVLKDKKAYAHEYTLEQIKQLNMAYSYEDESGNYPYRNLTPAQIDDNNFRITTLEEVLTYCESIRTKGDLHYIIEIKDGGDRGKKATDLLHQTLIDLDLIDRVVVGTFKMDITRYMDEAYDDFTRSAGMDEVFAFYFDFLYNVDLNKKDLGFEVMQIPYVIAGVNLGTQAFIDYAHHYGIALQYWTINEREDIIRLIDRGADCIITDNPELCDEIIYKK